MSYAAGMMKKDLRLEFCQSKVNTFLFKGAVLFKTDLYELYIMLEFYSLITKCAEGNIVTGLWLKNTFAKHSKTFVPQCHIMS